MLPNTSSGQIPFVSRRCVFVLFISIWCAQAQALARPFIKTALRVQTQSATGSTDKEKRQKKKGLAPLRQEEAPEGSRVTITYNTALSDYSAYRQGDRFVVVIPKADAPRVRNDLRGRGFDGVQVEKRGDDVVLSFRIQSGVRARVDQQHNRLDVVFSAPEPRTSEAAANQRQTTQAASGTTPTPLANHNLSAATTVQPNRDKQSRDSSAEAAVTETQASVTTATSAHSPAPSSEPAAATAQPTVDRNRTAQSPPAVSPAAANTSLSLFAARHWLLLLIAALLIASAGAVIASRRRAKAQAEALAETPAVMQPETNISGEETEETAAVAIVDDAAPSEPAEPEEEATEIEPAAVEEEKLSSIPPTILRHLGSEDENERAAGVLGLADIGSDEAFGRIGAAFDDQSQRVRDAAARSLFNVSADRVASFKRIMRESSPERRRRVGEAIGSSGMAGEAISDLTSESGERAYDALLVLSLMARAGEVRSLIETIEEHPVTEVRLAIVKLLALSGQQEILQTFRYLATRDSLPIAVRSSIMEAIYQLNNAPPLNLN